MAQEERPAIEIRINTTPEEAHEFLQRLARDEEFRDRLRRDPREVLEEYHVEISEAAIPESPELPPVEHVEAILRQIEVDQYGKVAYVPLGHGLLVLILAFAMPLVATDEQEGDGAS